MENLTKKQQELYDFIAKYIKNNNKSPTIRELAYVFQRSVGSIHPMLKIIAEKGYISYEKNKTRSIKINLGNDNL